MASTPRPDMTDDPATGASASPPPSQPRSRRRRRVAKAAAGLGVACAVLVGAGVVADVMAFDRTSGGYEPPYEGWTGEPIDWTAAEVTSQGLSRSGFVLRTHLDCTTGMISFGTLGLSIDFRPVSERAIVVHQPREACEAAGFSPEF